MVVRLGASCNVDFQRVRRVEVVAVVMSAGMAIMGFQHEELKDGG